MKVVHLKKENTPEDGPVEIKQLEEIIKNYPANQRSYNRLMTLYRKQGNYKKELQTINRAIRTFEALFKKRQPPFNKMVKALSIALSKATGLSDKKGNPIYQMGDLSKWKKRKELVSKKILIRF